MLDQPIASQYPQFYSSDVPPTPYPDDKQNSLIENNIPLAGYSVFFGNNYIHPVGHNRPQTDYCNEDPGVPACLEVRRSSVFVDMLINQIMGCNSRVPCG